MQFSVILIAAATLGIDYGWQPLEDGQLEYIIQIEPELLSAMRQGEEVVSELTGDVRGVRRFRIKIGNDPLPREGQMLLVADDPPQRLPKASDVGKPIRPVSVDEQTKSQTRLNAGGKRSDGASGESPPNHSLDTEPEKPWIWLTVTLLGLFVSIGANAYLGWIMLAIRRQYHQVVADFENNPSPKRSRGTGSVIGTPSPARRP